MTTMTIPGPSLPPPHFSLLLTKAIHQQILSLSSCSQTKAAGRAAIAGAGQPVALGAEVAAQGSPVPASWLRWSVWGTKPST